MVLHMKEKSLMPDAVLERILISMDWDLLREKLVQDRRIVRQLISRVYAFEGLLFWRLVEAIGIAAETIDEQKPAMLPNWYGAVCGNSTRSQVEPPGMYRK
jgi:hypothetical protein